MIVAVHTDDFLCHIRVTLYIVFALRQHILTVSRYLNGQLVAVDFRCKVQIFHNAENFSFRNFNTEYAVYLADADGNRGRINRVSCIHIEMGAGNFTAAELFHQVQRTFHTKNGRILIYAFLISCAGIRCFSKCTGCLSDVVACEFCGLKHNGLCRVADLGV